MNFGVLDSTEQAANAAAKDDLFRLVASGTTLLMVGAGCSAYVKYKTWWQLLNHYETEASKVLCAAPFVTNSQKLEKLPLEYADELEQFHEQHQPRWFRRQIEYHFRDNGVPLTPLHRELVTLPFKGIMTTNYDTCLSRALVETDQAPKEDASFQLMEKGSPYLDEFLARLQGYRSNDYAKRIFHIHGLHNYPDNAVLTGKDYFRAYGYRPDGRGEAPREWELRRKLLWALPAMSRLIFTGFSLEDPYFHYGLRTVGADLLRTNTPVHYALMGISKETKAQMWTKADQLRRACAVQVVFAEEEHLSYKGLPALVSELADYCHTRPPVRFLGARHDPFRPHENSKT